jgi:hypothetical protein
MGVIECGEGTTDGSDHLMFQNVKIDELKNIYSKIDRARSEQCSSLEGKCYESCILSSNLETRDSDQILVIRITLKSNSAKSDHA